MSHPAVVEEGIFRALFIARPVRVKSHELLVVGEGQVLYVKDYILAEGDVLVYGDLVVI